MKLELKQNSPEWIEYRQNKIGCSEIATIIGWNPYKTAYDLFLEKVGKRPKFEGNFATERGKMLEPIALDLFDKRFKITRGQVYQSGVLIASLDAETEDAVVEVKCPQTVKWPLTKIPDVYYPQVQFQMYVTGLKLVHYVEFDVKDIQCLTIEYNEKFIEENLPKIEEFWNAVQSGIWIEDKVKTDNSLKPLLSDLLIIQAKLKELEKQESNIRGELKQKVTERTRCENYILEWTERVGSVDYSKIPELKGVDLEKYRKASVKVFSIKERS